MQIDDEYCCGNCDDCPYYEVVDNGCLLMDVLTEEVMDVLTEEE